MPKASEKGEVRPKFLFSYGQLTVPLAVAGLPSVVYLPPFYAQDMALGLSMVGLVLLLARLSDVITDPLIGWISDRVNPRFGRRRSFVLIGAPLMATSVHFLYSPAGEISPVYFFVWVSLFYLGWTLITIPYDAMGAEASPDYDQRSRITGVKHSFSMLGLIVASVVPVLATRDLGAGETASRASINALGELTLILLPLAVIVFLAGTKDVKVSPRPAARTRWRDGLSVLATNAALRRLMLSLLLGSVASAISVSVMIMYFADALKLSSAEGPELILAYLAASLIGAPLWAVLARRTSKHRAFVTAMCVSAGATVLTPLVSPGQFYLMAAIQLLVGLAYPATLVVGQSMLADIIDADRLSFGRERAGVLMALYSMMIKASDAIGVAIAFPVLELFNYHPGGDNSAGEIMALIAVFAFFPVVFRLLAIVPMLGYPLTREKHEQLRARIAADSL